jgi:hypothetical protein
MITLWEAISCFDGVTGRAANRRSRPAKQSLAPQVLNVAAGEQGRSGIAAGFNSFYTS